MIRQWLPLIVACSDVLPAFVGDFCRAFQNDSWVILPQAMPASLSTEAFLAHRSQAEITCFESVGNTHQTLGVNEHLGSASWFVRSSNCCAVFSNHCLVCHFPFGSIDNSTLKHTHTHTDARIRMHAHINSHTKLTHTHGRAHAPTHDSRPPTHPPTRAHTSTCIQDTHSRIRPHTRTTTHKRARNRTRTNARAHTQAYAPTRVQSRRKREGE